MRSANLGNGSVLIGLDNYGQVKDFYFHYAGLENHAGEHFVHKIGFWVDGGLYWLDNPVWSVSVYTEKDTMASRVVADSDQLGLTVTISDILYNEKNIFIRRFDVVNKHDSARRIKVFFNQQFNISQTHTGDTAYFDPRDQTVIHYKGRRVFLINLLNNGAGVQDYSVGLFGIEGKDGTFKDCEDGELSKNPIEHGQVDSVVGCQLELEPNSGKTFHYWVTIAKSLKVAKKLNQLVLSRGPEDIIKTTKDYWTAWVKNQNFSFYGLPEDVVELFNKSLIIIRTHVNKNGSIIASGDSGMLQYGRDTYGYVWPRDAAISAVALAKAGDFNASRRFFEYCNAIITSDGYFMHKYRPDKSVGSSWHPWIRDGKEQLPIQEDETALVIWALWKHFEFSKDLEFVESIYNTLVKSAAEFMCSFVDKKTGLPKPSYDIWEEKFGTNTFTSSTVFAALNSAGKFAALLGKQKSASKYYAAAQKIKLGILKYLYDEKEGYFYKLINQDNGSLATDKTVDVSSFYGVYKFEVLTSTDPILVKAYDYVRDRLTIKTDVGGIARFEGDIYHKFPGNNPGNPWLITSLWLTKYRIDHIASEADIPGVVKDFIWVKEKALASGALPEQLNPYTGEAVSATPLIWSHAEYVIAIVNYLERLEELGICKACYPVN